MEYWLYSECGKDFDSAIEKCPHCECDEIWHVDEKNVELQYADNLDFW